MHLTHSNTFKYGDNGKYESYYEEMCFDERPPPGLSTLWISWRQRRGLLTEQRTNVITSQTSNKVLIPVMVELYFAARWNESSQVSHFKMHFRFKRSFSSQCYILLRSVIKLFKLGRLHRTWEFRLEFTTQSTLESFIPAAARSSPKPLNKLGNLTQHRD